MTRVPKQYMICAYGPYSASATGGNGWARDFLAGVLTVPALPFFENIGRSSGKNLEYASTILFCISFVLVVAVYVIYWKGPALRKKSPFAQRLANARAEGQDMGRRGSVAYDPQLPERRRSKFSPPHSLSFCLKMNLVDTLQQALPLLLLPLLLDRTPTGDTVSRTDSSERVAPRRGAHLEARRLLVGGRAWPTLWSHSDSGLFSLLL